MATIIVMVMCAAAEGFLLYVLAQFARELRRGRAVHVATGAKMIDGREFGKVIEIPGPSRVPSHSRDRRMAS